MRVQEPLHDGPQRFGVALGEVTEPIVADDNGAMLDRVLQNVRILVIRTGVDDSLANEVLQIGNVIGSLEVTLAPLSDHSLIVVGMDLLDSVDELAMHEADALVSDALEVLQRQLDSLAAVVLIAVVHSDVGDVENDDELAVSQPSH